MMFIIKDWRWDRISKRDNKTETFCCPYCNGIVSVAADRRIIDMETGAIHYYIFECPQCHMPVTKGLDGRIIPPSQFLPFETIAHLPDRILKLHTECRKTFLNGCYYAAIMVTRSLIMYIAVDKGAQEKKSFEYYVDYLETAGYTSSHNRSWVDKIRKLGNHYIHEIDEATKEEAEKIIVFVSQLLKNVYELPQMAMEVREC